MPKLCPQPAYWLAKFTQRESFPDCKIILSSRTIASFSNIILLKNRVKAAVRQAVYDTICLKCTGGPLIERRAAKRFQVDWQIRVEGNNSSHGTFVESGVVRNISSSGALLSLSHALPAGTQLDVYIQLPLKGEAWMKYPARVVRADLDVAGVTAAVRFDSARPDFGTPLVP